MIEAGDDQHGIVELTVFTESDFLKSDKPQAVISQHKRYQKNKSNLANMGIQAMLTPNETNDELQAYMNEKAYDTASLGETSADELSMHHEESSGVEIYRDSDLDRKLNERLNLATAVKDSVQAVIVLHGHIIKFVIMAPCTAKTESKHRLSQCVNRVLNRQMMIVLRIKPKTS